ncbi:MAG: hypothetical protein R6V11_01350 [Ectothiorhodospiraceae bacterium]
MASTSSPTHDTGSIILSALVLLVVASVLAAGVARLVSSGTVASSDRVLVERALFALESARFSGQSCTDLQNDPETMPSGAAFTCQPGACERDGLEDQDVLVGFAGGDSPDDARAVERVCTQPSNLTPGDIEDCDDCDLIEGDDCPSGESEFEKESSGTFGYACDQQAGNTQLKLKDTDGVFFEPAEFKGSTELTFKGGGADGIGIVFLEDVTLSGDMSLKLKNINVCFGGNVEVNGSPEIEIESSTVRFTEGEPDYFSSETDSVEGGSCEVGDGDAWEYAL